MIHADVRVALFAVLAGGRRLQRVQTGRINHYVLGIAVGAGLLVAVSWVLR